VEQQEVLVVEELIRRALDFQKQALLAKEMQEVLEPLAHRHQDHLFS